MKSYIGYNKRPNFRRTDRTSDFKRPPPNQHRFMVMSSGMIVFPTFDRVRF